MMKVLYDLETRLQQMDGDSLVEFLTSQIPAASQAEVKKAMKVAGAAGKQQRKSTGDGDGHGIDLESDAEDQPEHLLEKLQGEEEASVSRKEQLEEMMDESALAHANEDEDADEDMSLLHTASAVDDPIDRDD